MMASLSYLLVVLRSIATYRRAQRVSATALQSLADRTELVDVISRFCLYIYLPILNSGTVASSEVMPWLREYAL
jgi:hypothetical protein